MANWLRCARFGISPRSARRLHQRILDGWLKLSLLEQKREVAACLVDIDAEPASLASLVARAQELTPESATRAQLDLFVHHLAMRPIAAQSAGAATAPLAEKVMAAQRLSVSGRLETTTQNRRRPFPAVPARTQASDAHAEGYGNSLGRSATRIAPVQGVQVGGLLAPSGLDVDVQIEIDVNAEQAFHLLAGGSSDLF